VFADHLGSRDEIMCDVAWVEPEEDQLRLISLLGEETLLRGRIKSIDLLDSRIVVELRMEGEGSLPAPGPE
jgi:predicted RNA-binding protein